MKKLIFSIACGSIMIAAACNSTKSVSGASDSTRVDTTMKPIDTNKVKDTTKTLPPDTMKKQQPD
ncbi:hypothetical protein SAMN05421820_108122 [Pedobacter steynii]|uniref:Coproporphyrinogen III oxidase n=1 Tax=Pedobacter steynii TaxID=430522 RepID=A0A1H0CHS7_9SPHI|nr:hypothetical protein [Pedobacter steynii]NQX41571.1 coproporphyrinogen III oxidase [Pedobacter steynii]SDN57402.1 hypothetical protein SAMN05421820_108122 [Pedobacter steynii]